MAQKTGTIALNSRTLYWRMTITEDSYNVANNTSTLSYEFAYYMSAGSGGWADGNSIMFQLGINGYTSLINCFYVNGTLQSSIKNNQTYTNQAGTYKFNYLGGGSTYRTAKFCPKGQSGENADVIAESKGTVTISHNADGSGTAYLQARFGMAGTGAAATKGTIHTMTSDTITLTDLRKTATVSAGTGATISPTTSSYQVNLNGAYTVSGTKLTLPIGSSTSSITASAQTGYNTPTWNRASGTMTGDLSFTASATKITYAVTYNKGDASSGTAPSAQTKTYGTALTLATNSGNLAKSSTSISNNRTGQAITLSYNANNGTGAPSNNTGTGVTVPGSYTRSFSFNGWGTSSGTETVAYSAGASYTSNAALTLYPAWKHTDGSTSYTATSASATVSSTKPSRTGYTFQGWSTSSTATTASYAAGATYTESITASKTVTLYAVWKINTWSVTYNKGDASSGTAPSAQTKTYGTDLKLATNTGSLAKSSTTITNNRTNQTITLSYNANGGTGAPSNNVGTGITVPGSYTRSFSFAGWNTSSGTETVAYASGGTYTGNAALSLYPAWSHSDGSTSYTSTSASATVSSTAPTRTGYTFKGWSTSSTATSASYASGATYSDKITASKTVTLYAVWQINTWTVSYNKGDATSGTAPAAQTKTYGQNLTLATNSGNLAHSATTQAGTKTITLSYDANGGSSTPASGTGTAETTATVTWTANGWSTSSGGSKAYDFGGTFTANTGATLYPSWYTYTALPTVSKAASITTAAAISRANGAAAGYLISYNSNGGSGAPAAQTSGDRTITYSFNQWNTNSSGSGTAYAAGTAASLSADTKLYAIWNSSTSSSSSWTVSSTIPTKSGYEFLGWSTSSTAKEATYLPGNTYTITAGLTLYAVWLALGSVHVWTGSEWKYGQPYVWTENAWKSGTGYVYDGSAWKQGT